MRQWNLALGFYQNPYTARHVLSELRAGGFHRSASIHHTHDGHFITDVRPPLFWPLSILSILVVALILLNYFLMNITVVALSAVAILALGGAIWLYLRYYQTIDPEVLSRFQRWVLRDETLIITQVDAAEVTTALTILRSVKSGHPLSFLLRSDLLLPSDGDELHSEPLTIEQLQERAVQLATTLQEAKLEEGHDQVLLKRLDKSEQLIRVIHHDVAEAEDVEQTVTASAEWLLDNIYVIRGAAAEVRRSLPKKYYRELPKMVDGPMAGLPRIYALSKEFVDLTAGRINSENLDAFFTHYQTIDPLTIGELWALPMMLRIRLVECIKFLALKVDQRLREGEAAGLWGNRLLNIARREPDRLTAFLADLAREEPNPSPHFAEELLDHLFDDEAIIPLVRKWLEECFGTNIQEVIQQEQKRKTTEQVELSNAIVSLITLSQLSWRDVFEKISPVDAILNEDPIGIYPKMDFSTRDSYRHSVEIIARRSALSETELAKVIIQMANQGTDDVTRHVGYYLVDYGRPLLEKAVHYKPKWKQKIRRWMLLHPATTYVGGICLLTLIFAVIAFYLALTIEMSWSYALIFSALAVIPLSELSVQIFNLFLSRVLSPFVLPRMSFEEEIPEENRTVVVMPMMLTGPDAIREHARHLEVYYLANTEPVLRFALFADYVDAPEAQRKCDEHFLEIAIKEIEALEKKYGEGKFFLFCRSRSWSESEGAWIGWERKRGKLEFLNRFLMGEQLPENILYVGKRDALENTRYVITLDADTQLPKDKARQLIETLAHPLNVPRVTLEGNIKRGYTIIQPRVSSHLPQSRVSLFARIFADVSGTDPYSHTVFDVYQDLAHEGSYHGKGIYDLHAFHHILTGRFPDSHILSHDLIEGAYARVGYASDVVLYDSFPEDYAAWSRRQQRWMRGDWQILDWLFSHVPSREKKATHNPLSPINRWKIFDNLRRALFPISCTLLLVASWLFASADFLWTLVIILVFFVPAVVAFLCNLCLHPRYTLQTWDQPLQDLFKVLINLILLPHQAFLSFDALCRVLYRRYISRRNLLEWGVGRQPASSHRTFIRNLGASSVFAIVVLWAVNRFHPDADDLAIGFCFLWIISPLIVALLDKVTTKTPLEQLDDKQRLFVRQLARKTWRFFDELIGPQTNWLPPDNYQAALGIEIAQRTSPTNIGLAMLSVVSAYDLHYVTSDDAIERLFSTVETLKKLERYEGHLLNWYDIRSLTPLYPRYVSTVDSGNLLASFWTLEQSLHQMIYAPLLSPALFNGLQDTVALLQQCKDSHLTTEVLHSFYDLPSDLVGVVSRLRVLQASIQELLSHSQDAHQEANYWLLQLQKQLLSWKSTIDRYFSWVEMLSTVSREQLDQLDPHAWQWREEALKVVPSLQQFASGEWNAGLKEFVQLTSPQSLLNDPNLNDLKGWLKNLQEALQRAKWLAGEKSGQVSQLLTGMRELANNTNMAFLYNKDRKVFSIGYNVSDRKLDSSYYDLLASEARLASLVAIAKEDAPLDHWWALGRPYAIVYGRQVLRSWGGTMFEYLMPLLFTHCYPDSLLGDACEAAVACQITYGDRRGIPWGISESAFSAIDMHKTYQYRSFGVPGLGFKRGLEEDIVVSPYSSALASMIDPVAAVKNLQTLHRDPLDLLSLYGYYESVDFTRQRGPHGERGVIVYAYMAHHHGMTLLALNNVLNNNCIVERFHADPRVRGIESLLYERIPLNPPIVRGLRKTVPISRLVPFSTIPIMGVVDTAHSATPKVNLLSNGDYSVMVTNAGGGYSRWRDRDITRWRSDTTTDAWGSYCYLKEMETGNIWSAAYHPTFAKGEQYEVSFKSDKAEYRRRDHQVETLTEIVVSPEDNAEVRLITLANLSKEQKTIELTSYSELALAPHLTDRAHPAFNKMFIETEALPELSGLLAFRRLRSPDDPPIWAAHVVATNQKETTPFQYETDRNRFIGRGRSLEFPAALDGELSNTHGYVMDPIFSLRRRLVLEPGQRVQIAFVTAVSDNREGAIALVKKYSDLTSSHRALEMAWAYAQLELRHLRVHQEEAQLFQKLASRVLYPHAQLRPPAERLQRNRLGQSRLWAYGISGDLPIVVATIADTHEMDLIKQILTAHAFWRMRGLKTDLVILNEEASGYERPLFEQLQRVIQAHSQPDTVDKPGGIFLRSSDQIPEEDLTLLLSVSRANLVAARGSLRQQLVSPTHSVTHPPRLIPNKQLSDSPSGPLPFMELPFFNGLGGFTSDGKEYVIYLGPNTHTPAPWINVLANPQFGTLVSETSIGSTWYENSQTNRLTPWSNDPVLDPSSDALYIRDEELGTVWTPTPAPIRELDAYRIRHGQGYTQFEHNSHGIEQMLTVFVPVDAQGGLPLRIQRLRLRNRSPRKRLLSVTAYSTWVLGTDREETQMHVNTEWDTESQALFAYNYYNPDFSGNVAFTCACSPIHSYTADRTEFLGRNSCLSTPEALRRKTLSGTTGAALDACSALQVQVELAPDQETDLVFIMGYADSREAARKLIAQAREAGFIDQLQHRTQEWWDQCLGQIQIEVPDLAVNFACNRWLLYQVLSCRIWGRTAFYQSSGAYGFRDQLQDVLALIHTQPQIAREQILRAAAHQFIEGDVQHWWHPPSNGGVRTRISDDLLWLPYVTAHYVRTTQDRSVLDEVVPFLKGPLLEENQHEAYFVPEVSSESGTLLEHCRRSIQKGVTSGPHGLPLIGTGDWNDGFNRVGIQGQGESVWLAWFLCQVLHDFADLIGEAGEGFKQQAKRLAEVVESKAWDGQWYCRAYFDDGTPLGSKSNPESSIDSLAQSWAVISGAGDATRSTTALNSAIEHLVKTKERLIQLLTPPFDKSDLDPGYIKGYPPGVRENGAQYTHGSSWVTLALARQGRGDQAVDLLRMIMPMTHASTLDEAIHYQVEPYVLAGDVYALPERIGQGGWSWYTGSAGWVYRIWIEEIFGLKRQGDRLTLNPVIHSKWERVTMRYRHHSSLYVITIENPDHLQSGKIKIEVDGSVLTSSEITLLDDEKTHTVRILLCK